MKRIQKLALNTKTVTILDDDSIGQLKGGGTYIWNICPTSVSRDTLTVVGDNTMPSVKGPVAYCQ